MFHFFLYIFILDLTTKNHYNIHVNIRNVGDIMSILVNFKICDNCADCSGIRVCPVHAITWNDEKKSIEIDNSKCIKCGQCVDNCTVNAIRLAHTDEEYAEIKREIENDPRTISDLFVERYGSMKISDINCFDIEHIEDRINSNRPVIIEINTEDTIECLLRSVPISEIQKKFNANATYSKFFVESCDMEKYNLTTTPVLRFYNKGVMIGEIVGHFTPNDKYEYLDQIKDFGSRIK